MSSQMPQPDHEPSASIRDEDRADRNKKVLKIAGKSAAIIAGLAIISAIYTGVVNARHEQIPTDASEQGAEGPVNPPQDDALAEVDSADNTPPETAQAIPESEDLGPDSLKFLGEDGETFITFDELSAPIEIPADANDDSIAAQVTYYEHIQDMANNSLPPIHDEDAAEEVHNNLNIPADQQLTSEDVEAAAALKFKAYDKLYETPAGDLYEFAQKLARQVAYNQLIGQLEGDSVLYEIDIRFAETEPVVVITDNIGETSLSENMSTAGTYDLTFTGFGPNEVTTPDGQSVWRIAGNTVITERDTAAAN